MRKLFLALIAVVLICGMINQIAAEGRKSSWGRVRPQDMSYGAAVNTAVLVIPACPLKTGAAGTNKKLLVASAEIDTFVAFVPPVNCIIENFILVPDSTMSVLDTLVAKHYAVSVQKRNGTTYDTLGYKTTASPTLANMWTGKTPWNITIVDSTAKEMSKDSVLLFMIQAKTGQCDSIGTGFKLFINWYPTARQ